MALSKRQKRQRIKTRVRSKVRGTAERPRLSVFRSNKQIYAQVIDDLNGVTLASASSIKVEEAKGVNKLDQALAVGKAVASNAKAAGVTQVIFDRNGYIYHGRIQKLAEGAREGGLEF